MGSCVPCNGELPPEEATPAPVAPDGSLPPDAIGEQELYRAAFVSQRRFLDGK